MAGLELSPSLLERTGELLRRGDVLLRLGLCVLTAVGMLLVTQAWKPPLTFREGQTPRRAIVAAVPFQVPDKDAVRKAREAAERQAPQVYVVDAAKLPQLRARLLSQLALLTNAKQFDEKTAEVWQDFMPTPVDELEKKPTADPQKQGEAVRRQYESFCAGFRLKDSDLRGKYDDAVKRSLAEFEDRGLIDKLEDTGKEHNQAEVVVFVPERWKERKTVAVKDVRIADVKPRILANLKRELDPLEKDLLEHARQKALQVYVLSPEPLVKLRGRLKEAIAALAKAPQFDDATAKLWLDFQPKPTDEAPLPKPDEQQKLFEKFREAVTNDEARTALDADRKSVV